MCCLFTSIPSKTTIWCYTVSNASKLQKKNQNENKIYPTILFSVFLFLFFFFSLLFFSFCLFFVCILFCYVTWTHSNQYITSLQFFFIFVYFNVTRLSDLEKIFLYPISHGSVFPVKLVVSHVPFISSYSLLADDCLPFSTGLMQDKPKNKKGICCFSIKQVALKTKSKDLIVDSE